MVLTVLMRDHAYQQSVLITILILGFLIDKNRLVAQLHENNPADAGAMSVSSAMTVRERMRIGSTIVALGAAALAACLLQPRAALADDTVTLSLTLKNHQFDPAELHAPPGKPIEFRITNQNDIVSEFESSDLHFEKIVPAGTGAAVHVRPLQPGRYNFYDDFHHETQGYLVVP
jgi:plastocyanin